MGKIPVENFLLGLLRGCKGIKELARGIEFKLLEIERKLTGIEITQLEIEITLAGIEIELLKTENKLA